MSARRMRPVAVSRNVAISRGVTIRNTGHRTLAALDHASAFTGASHTKRSMRGWGLRSSSDPDDEVLADLETLRDRSRDLFKNNPIASGAIKTMVTNIVGTGLKLQSRIDYEVLGMTEEEADDWESNTERLWKLWAESTEADAGRRMNFYEIQWLAFLSTLISGEAMALMPIIPRPGTSSPIRVQLIEADRVSNKDDLPDTEDCAGGIEIGKYGEPVAYLIMTSAGGLLSPLREWKRVSAFGTSGRQNVLHVYEQLRPGQRRGVPFLTPVIDTLKQMGRFSEAELMRAVVSSMFTVFVKSASGDTGIIGNSFDDADMVDPEGRDYELGHGAVVGLAPDEDVAFANPAQNGANFDTLMAAYMHQVGMALEIPYELLIHHFTASYSASRAALLEAWKMFRTRRAWLASKLCQPVYEEWLTDAVLAGRISAPGFFDSIETRRAYCGAVWVGPAPGQVDPVKEVEASKARVAQNLSTEADEALQNTGADWEKVVRQRAKEERLKKKLGLVPEIPAPYGAPAQQQAKPEEPDEDDAEEPDPLQPPKKGAKKKNPNQPELFGEGE